MTSVNYIKDDTGSTFIPSSQRPDGSWRRPIRVKDGYVPQEEQPLYVSKGKQTPSSPYPVGLSASDISSYSYSSNTNSSSKGQKGGSLYFDVGLYTPAPVTHPIPGLNFVDTPVPEKTSSKSRSKKSKNKNKLTEPAEDSSETTTATTTGKKSISQNNSQSTPSNVTDPVKRLRNLRKKLKDIEALEKKIDSGELKNPEKEQLEKIQRKDEVIDEVDELERLIEHFNLS